MGTWAHWRTGAEKRGKGGIRTHNPGFTIRGSSVELPCDKWRLRVRSRCINLWLFVYFQRPAVETVWRSCGTEMHWHTGAEKGGSGGLLPGSY